MPSGAGAPGPPGSTAIVAAGHPSVRGDASPGGATHHGSIQRRRHHDRRDVTDSGQEVALGGPQQGIRDVPGGRRPRGQDDGVGFDAPLPIRLGEVHGDALSRRLERLGGRSQPRGVPGRQRLRQIRQTRAQGSHRCVAASDVAEQEEDATRRFRIAEGRVGGEGCHPAVQDAAAEVEAGEVRDAAIIQACSALGPVGIEDAAEAAQDPRQAPQAESLVEAHARETRHAQHAHGIDGKALPAAHLGEAERPQRKELLLETCRGDQAQEIPVGGAHLVRAGIEAEALPPVAGRPASDAVGALQDRHPASPLAQPPGGGQSGDSCANHDDVAAAIRHGVLESWTRARGPGSAGRI